MSDKSTVERRDTFGLDSEASSVDPNYMPGTMELEEFPISCTEWASINEWMEYIHAKFDLVTILVRLVLLTVSIIGILRVSLGVRLLAGRVLNTGKYDVPLFAIAGLFPQAFIFAVRFIVFTPNEKYRRTASVRDASCAHGIWMGFVPLRHSQGLIFVPFSPKHSSLKPGCFAYKPYFPF